MRLENTLRLRKILKIPLIILSRRQDFPAVGHGRIKGGNRVAIHLYKIVQIVGVAFHRHAVMGHCHGLRPGKEAGSVHVDESDNVKKGARHVVLKQSR